MPHTPTEKQIDAATDAYLKARGWDDEMIKSHKQGREEVRERMMLALLAHEEAREPEVGDVQNPG